MSLIDNAGLVCAAMAVISAGYWIASVVSLHAFFRKTKPNVNGAKAGGDNVGVLPRVTFFRPLKPGVAGLRSKLRVFVEETREHDQILFGVQAGTDESVLCEELVCAFPARDLSVVVCDRLAALNPKIANLMQMAPLAKHDHWIVLDGEFVATPGWLIQFLHEWRCSGVDAFTAGYRFTGITTFLQSLDATPILLSLWPGVGIVARNGQLRFMLGAVIALHRNDLEMLGGWQRFSDVLAEDNRLGTALVQSGKSVGLSRSVATLASDSLPPHDYWRHQRRVAVTYRVCSPSGFAGMICTHGITFAFVFVLLEPWSGFAWLIMGITLACRWWTARRLSWLLDFPIPYLYAAVTVASLIETATWIAAWVSTEVWWAGRRWRVQRSGKLELIPNR